METVCEAPERNALEGLRGVLGPPRLEWDGWWTLPLETHTNEV